MTLLDDYGQKVALGEIEDDKAQRQVIAELQRVVDELAALKASWFSFKRKQPVQGLYLYGPVGVGKTYLVDLFYQHVPETAKARFHFHHFMQQVDAELRRLQGHKDPLLVIAARLAKSIRLLCFDEFLVHDVADAMILSELLQALLSVDIVLVGTSNTSPDELYKDGVQRDRFVPAIELIKAHCQVISLNERRDYRLGREPLALAYLYPLNSSSAEDLSRQFSARVLNPVEGGALTIQQRPVPCVKHGARTVWFHFDDICNLPRSQLDYLEIADRFDTVFVSDIPVLTTNDTVRAILLIHFIDVMYDRGIEIFLSAAVPIQELYVAGAMVQEFQRTKSRLEEMQSEDYLRRHQHRQMNELEQD
jgi:cell division protein ZapE